MRLNKNIKYFIGLLILIGSNTISGQINDGYLSACAKMETGNFSSAIILLSEELSHSSNNELYIKRGICYCKTGDNKNAINDFLIAEKSKKGIASIYLARLYAKNNNIDESLKWLSIHLLSDYKLQMNEILLDEAFQNISSSREWGNFWNKKWYTSEEEILTEVYYLINRGENDEALYRLNRLVKGSKNPRAYYLRSKVYSEKNQNRNAINDLEKAIKYDGQNPEYLISTARLHMKNNNYDNAIKYYNRVLNNHPENFEIHKERIEAYIKSEKVNLAQNESEKLIQLFPENPELSLTYAEVLHKTGNNYDALKLYNTLLEKQLPKASYFNGRAKIFHDLKNYIKAISDYSMSLDINPHDPEVYFNRGNCRYANRNFSAACSDWKKAVMYGHREAVIKLQKYCNE
ncbi:tetratricopeptide repeat protein [Bacteroidota bacterium]